MAICEQCKYFRRVKPASQLLAQASTTTDGAVSNTLAKIQEDEQQQKSYEAQAQVKKETANEEEWGFRPVMSSFCGLRELEGVFLIPGVKNFGGRCTDFAAGKPEKHACANCRHRIHPDGEAKDLEMEQAYSGMASAQTAVGGSTSVPESLLNKYHESIGPKKSFEIQGAYFARGIVAMKPRYLDYCGKFSTDGEFYLCALQNPHHTCHEWEHANLYQAPNVTQAGINHSPSPIKGPTEQNDIEDKERLVPAVNLSERTAPIPASKQRKTKKLKKEIIQSDTQATQLEQVSNQVLAQGKTVLTEKIVEDCKHLIEWCFELQFNPQQSVLLRKWIIECWQTNSGSDIAILEQFVVTWTNVQQASPQDRENSRKVLRPILAGTLFSKMNVGLPQELKEILSKRFHGGELIATVGFALLRHLQERNAQRASFSPPTQQGPISKSPAQQYASSGDPMQDAYSELDRIEVEIKSLQAAIVEAMKEGDTEREAILQLQLQKKMSAKERIVKIASTLGDMSNRTMMSIINNFRA